jgi:hypothetical protein
MRVAWASRCSSTNTAGAALLPETLTYTLSILIAQGRTWKASEYSISRAKISLVIEKMFAVISHVLCVKFIISPFKKAAPQQLHGKMTGEIPGDQNLQTASDIF